VSDRLEKLHRIAAANQEAEAGQGLSEGHFVPACTIYNRIVAADLKQKLIDAHIDVQEHRDRLCTRFSVPRNQLRLALQLRDDFLVEQPDVIPKRFSRDYDSFFLLSPFLLLVMALTLLVRMPKFTWAGVMISGITMMIILELANRRYRNIQKRQFRIADLVWLITLVALNLAVWRVILF
jgi:Flp pilus assembly protein TadB